MKRRDFLKAAAAGVVGGALLGPLVASAKSRANVVVIIGDDMGISDLGCYGSEISTPNIDRLADGGLRFKNFYVEPMCIPARATILTGIYETKSLEAINGKKHLSKNTLSLAEVLQTDGYATAMSGKWHLGERVTPCERGFDRYFGTLYGAGSFFAPLSLMRDMEKAEHEFEAKDFYYTDAISDNAIKYIEDTPSDKPLFLYTAYTCAHWPLHARPEDIAKYRGKYKMGWDKLREQRFEAMKKLGVVSPKAKLSPRDSDVPAWKDEEHKEWQQRRMEVYAAQIEVMDRGIGRIVESLRRTGRLDNTILMYTVDNGACHVEYGPNRKGTFLNEKTRDGVPLRPGNLPEIMPGPEDTFQSVGRGWANASNTPYRLFKLHAHEGGIRNSLIVHWPEVIKKKGAITDAVAHLIDVMPTLLEATGAKHPKKYKGVKPLPVDGKSFLPVLKGKAAKPRGPMFWSWSNGQAVINGNWKLVRLKKSEWELYNIESDPAELNDLSAGNPEKVKMLESMWTDWTKDKGVGE